MSPNRQISSIILPARKILEPTLPSRSGPFTYQINSKIINRHHANQIASWIDKKRDPYTDYKNPYEFKLILRGSINGFTSDDFWNLCDNQKDIVVIMRVDDEILGAYNLIGWNKSSNDISCEDCFTFSFKYSFFQRHFLNRITRLNCHIYNDDIFGPCFTKNFYMCNNFDKERGCWWYHNQTERNPWMFQRSEIHESEIHGSEIHGSEIHGSEIHGSEIHFSVLESRNEDMHSGQEYFSYFSVNEYEVFQLH
ncbi:hypothetical protein C2G38_755774 [Gigaspora rosea]|uniref:TLDc domain-containing protein n=1 Tax=Gigaspora rosea TaxID=44941 RepID=A0A397VSK6_9GLOM|nr:hypothetical protein C2G38_755774 [Gigaspora rosea]